jgi:predicted nucleic acid-binding protein
VIFVDTSAIYAWADAADPNHRLAVRRLQAILDSGANLK